MNPLPPLPLVDGAFLIDNSSLEHYQTCRRLYELSDVRRYSIVSNAAGRNFGSALHAGLQVRYRMAGSACPSAEVRTACNEAIHAWFAASPAPVDDFRDAAHAVRMMEYYNGHYGAEPFRVLAVPGTPDRLMVERPFALELGTVQNVPIIWTGKLDLALENNDGTWNMDHKTAFQFGSGFEDDMSTNGGQLGYTWAEQQILGKKPTGYIINAIRVRRPSRAGKYAAEGGGPAPIDASDFVRIPHHVTDDALDEWREDVLALITDLFFDHDRGYFPRSRKACSGKYGRCDMFEVCTAPRHTRQNILDSSLFQPNTWSPLNQTKQQEQTPA
jgi:hypothetical protein